MDIINILEEGIRLKREGKYEEAKQKYIEVINIDKKEKMAYYNLGKVLYILGDYNASVNSYKIAYEMGVDSFNVLIHMGHSLNDCKYESGKYKDIINDYKNGIDPYRSHQQTIQGKYRKSNLSMNKYKELNDEYRNLCISSAMDYLNQK